MMPDKRMFFHTVFTSFAFLQIGCVNKKPQEVPIGRYYKYIDFIIIRNNKILAMINEMRFIRINS